MFLSLMKMPQMVENFVCFWGVFALGWAFSLKYIYLTTAYVRKGYE